MKVIVNGRFLLHKVTGVEQHASEILLVSGIIGTRSWALRVLVKY